MHGLCVRERKSCGLEFCDGWAGFAPVIAGIRALGSQSVMHSHSESNHFLFFNSPRAQYFPGLDLGGFSFRIICIPSNYYWCYTCYPPPELDINSHSHSNDAFVQVNISDLTHHSHTSFSVIAEITFIVFPSISSPNPCDPKTGHCTPELTPCPFASFGLPATTKFITDLLIPYRIWGVITASEPGHGESIAMNVGPVPWRPG